MTEAPTTSKLAEAAGISPSYASEILGNKRTPSLSLAAHIWSKTGWRHARVATYTDEQIASLAAAEPWSKSPVAEARAA